MACGIFSCSMQALSSLNRDRTQAPALGAWSLNCWTTREVPHCVLIAPLLTVFFFFFNKFIYSFISFWLRWVFVAVHGRAGATLHGRLLIAVASLCCRAQTLGARASVVAAPGLSSCGSGVLERRLSSCGTRA